MGVDLIGDGFVFSGGVVFVEGKLIGGGPKIGEGGLEVCFD